MLLLRRMLTRLHTPHIERAPLFTRKFFFIFSAAKHIAVNYLFPMAVSLGNVRPCVLTSFHHKPTPRVCRSNLRFSKNNRLRLLLTKFSPSSKRCCHFHPLKSSSINGFSVQNDSLEHFDGEVNVDFNEKIRRWIRFIQSILPGGSWWSFDDDVEVKIMAKPVTLWRALGKMWDLVSKDRWIIFAAFSALIIAAVRIVSSFVS